VHNLARSYWGRAFEAIKYSAVAAECCGISRSHYKIAAFVLSAALAALSGAAGLLLSYHLEIAAGASVALCAVVFAGVALAVPHAGRA